MKSGLKSFFSAVPETIHRRLINPVSRKLGELGAVTGRDMTTSSSAAKRLLIRAKTDSELAKKDKGNVGGSFLRLQRCKPGHQIIISIACLNPPTPPKRSLSSSLIVCRLVTANVASPEFDDLLLHLIVTQKLFGPCLVIVNHLLVVPHQLGRRLHLRFAN